MQFGRKGVYGMEDQNISTSNPRVQRSPYNLEKETGESGYGEMIYYDPNDVNFRGSNDMSPMTEGRSQFQGNRSPTNRFGQNVLSTVRADLNDQSNRHMNFNVNFENQRNERLSRSPKTINIGESEREVEYNIKTLNPRRSPKAGGPPIGFKYQQSTLEQYNSGLGMSEPGNIFLDQPMQSPSFIQGQGDILHQANSGINNSILGSSPGRSGLQNKSQCDFLASNSREIQYSMNPRDLREPFPNLNKMSPNKNVDDESLSDKQGNDTAEQLKDLKTQMDRNANMVNDDGLLDQEPQQQIRNDMDKIEDYVKQRELRNTITEGDIKKIVKQMTQGYEPSSGNNGGRLISTRQTIIPGSNDELFNDRYRVLQKMNKLSTILLARKNTNNPSSLNEGPNYFDTQTYQKKTFDRNTLNATVPGRRKQNISSNSANKFLYLSLAMINSKGKNCEDRLIFRNMRFDKGGVVDLAQEKFKKKDTVKVKKVNRKNLAGKEMMKYNPKYREKAAKIVQAWWRDLKERYQKILEKIILIQSCWRGRWLRKYIYDIIYLSFLHQRFCDSLQKIMVNHVRPIVWEELFGQQKWAKEIVRKIIVEKDSRFTLLRLSPFFERWKKNSKFLAKRNLKSKKLVSKKGENEKKLKELSKYFNSWKQKANLLKYIGKHKDAEKRKKQFFGMLKLVDGTNKAAKRNGLNAAKEPIVKHYLQNKLRNKKLKHVIKKCPKFENIMKRRAFNKWHRQLARYKLKDFKRTMFGSMIQRVDKNIDKKKLKNAFSLWRSKLPKDKLKKYMKGADKLRQFALRVNHKDPIKALKNKAEYESERDGVLRMFGVKNRYIRNHWRDYFKKWKNTARKMKDKDIHDKLYKALLNTMLNKRQRRILSNRFSQWRKQPKIDLDALFDRYKNLCNLTKKICNKAIKPDKEKFFKNAKVHRAPQAYKRACQRLFDEYINKDRTYLRYYLFKWTQQTKNDEILELKTQLIKYLAQQNENRNRRNKLAKAFGNWKVFVNKQQNKEHLAKLKKIQRGLDKLNKNYNHKLIDFMTRLYRKMDKDFRPNILRSIAKRLEKPRTSLSDAFNKWKRVKDLQKSQENLLKIKGKFLKGNAARINERRNRDRLLRGFFKWKNMARNPDDYYPKIAKGLKALNKLLKNDKCYEPFQRIRFFKNYNSKLNPVLKNKSNLAKRNDKELLRKKFNKWANICLKKNVKDLKGNLIYKTKNKNLSKTKNQILAKYFTKWKLFRYKKLDPRLTKGLDLLKNFCRRPNQNDVINAMKNKSKNSDKTKGAKEILNYCNKLQNKKLHNALLKFWKKAALTDPHKNDKIRTKLRRIVKEKSDVPLEKYFYLWLRKLVKNPDFKNTIAGSDKLKSGLIKLNKVCFNKIKNHISKDYLKKKLKSNVLPNSKLSRDRLLRNMFNRWKTNSKKLGIKALKAHLLSKTYCNGKNALRERFLRKYFNQWAFKLPEKKPIDYFNVVKSMDKLHKLFAKKYLKDLYPNMKQISKENLLKKLVKNSKKHVPRRLLPYFERWRKYKDLLKANDQIKDASSKFMTRTKAYRTSQKTQNLLRNKWHQWRRNMNSIKDKEKKNAPVALDKLKNFTMRLHVNNLLNGLENKAKENRKDELVKGLPAKREKCQLRNVKKMWDTWRNKVVKMVINEMQNKLKYNQLRHSIKMLEKGPLKYFLLWKFKAGMKRSMSPVQQGLDKIRKAILKDPAKRFFRIANMKNLVIPRGISIKSLLIRRMPNVAKSVALRNFALKPYYDKWKRQVNAIKNKENKVNIFQKLIKPNVRNIDRLRKRRRLRQWSNVVNKLKDKQRKKQQSAKMLKLIFGLCEKDIVRKNMKRWFKNSGLEKERIDHIGDGANMIKDHINRETLNKLKELVKKQKRMDNIKTKLKKIIKNNDKSKVKDCFDKWNNKTKKYKELILKSKLFRNLANKQDFKKDRNLNDNLRSALLRWRIKCAPRNYLDTMSKIRKGCKLLKLGIKKRYDPEVYDGIKNRGNDRLRRKILNKIVTNLKPKSDILNKKRAMHLWNDKVADFYKLKNKLADLCNRFVDSPYMKNKMFTEPEKQLNNMMNDCAKLRTDKADIISNYVKKFPNIQKQINKCKRTRILNKTINNKEHSDKDKKQMYLLQWLRNAKADKANDMAKIIQNFLKKRLNNPADKRKRINRGADFVDKFVKKTVLNKLKNKRNDNLKKNVLISKIKRQMKINNNDLQNAFNKWKNIMPIMRENEGANKIQNAYRKLRARKKMHNINKRNEDLIHLFKLKYLKHQDQKETTFRKWQKTAKDIQCQENAKIIQKFVKSQLKNLLKSKALDKLNDLKNKLLKHELAKAMNKASRIIGDKGQVMFNTLENIYIKRPFDKLKDGLKWIARIKKLKSVIPKVHETLKQHYLPPTCKKWKNKTYGDKMRKVIRIQRWNRKMMKLLKDKRNKRKNDLMNKIFERKRESDELKQKVPLKIWSKKAKLIKVNEDAKIIQNFIRNKMAQKLEKRLNSQKQLNDKFKKYLKHLLAEKMKNSKNLQKSLKNLLNKKSIKQGESNLKRFFDYWKYLNDKANKSANKIQTAFRAKQGRDKCKKLRNLKNILINRVYKLDKDRNSNLGSKLRQWSNKAMLVKCNEMSKIIQNFIKPRLIKAIYNKFTNLFDKKAHKKTEHILLTAAKVNKLFNALNKPKQRSFYDKLKKKVKSDKIKNILSKKIKQYNDKNKQDQLNKHFNRWKNNVTKFNTDSNQASEKIQNMFRNRKARDKVNNLKNRKKMLSFLLSKLISDEKLKKEVGFNVWKTNANRTKLNENAKIIQDFVRNIQNKILNDKLNAKNQKIVEGLEKLLNMKGCFRKPFNKIKSQANRNKFAIFFDDLENNRLKNLKYAFDAIKQQRKDEILIKTCVIHKNVVDRSLQKAFNKWKENMTIEVTNDAAGKIQRYYRKRTILKKKNKVNDILADRVNKLSSKNTDKVNYYYNLWKKNMIQGKIMRSGKRINDFITNKYKDAKAKKNWSHMANVLQKQKDSGEMENLINKMKKYIGLARVSKPITRHVDRELFKYLTELYNSRKAHESLNKLFLDVDKKNNQNLLQKYFNNWKNKINQMDERNSKLNDALNKITLRQKIIGVNAYNNASLMKRFIKSFIKARKANFLDRLKNKVKENEKMESLKNKFKDVKDDLADKNKRELMNKLYKLFIYRKLEKFTNYIGTAIKNKMPEYGHDIFQNLYGNLQKNSFANYEGKKSAKYQCPTTKLSFKKKIVNPKQLLLQNDNASPVIRVLPFFVEFLNRKIQERKQQVMDKLNDNDRDGRFCALLKKFSIKQRIPQKKDLINEMKEKNEYIDTKGQYLIKLFKLLRKKWIRTVGDSMVEPNKIYKLIYLLRMTYMHKTVAKQRFAREVTRKWRFAAFVKKMTRKKLELMYKNLHVSYLQMANEVFGDEDEMNPSVMKEFERFGNNIGMFNAEDPSINHDISKKYVKTVQKKYVFKDSLIEDEIKTPKRRIGNYSKISYAENDENEEMMAEEIEEKYLNKTNWK